MLLVIHQVRNFRLFSCFQFLLVVELVARDVDIDR